ncbi:2-dehydro-3-deoxygalactonokinase [Roseateles koreensis]|uniref:2-dehydro-3-deoxygalactonokinase n=1 Tax=Roseateles koreensis TaxID=2987526 RepID=A0ABT5KV79_9BURK|nr:2-dehydro-3-deoxygalactonokinase [Roseateles koreensis]MDC8786829.1 2-dehydro-3-deoxygalactonokinase [Roseateles koreensis]
MVTNVALSSATATEPALLALDWGSTGLRAFLLDARGHQRASRSASLGASAMNGQADSYVAALTQVAGDWLQTWPTLPVVACGMVGAKHGWREAPYVPCPADAHALAAQAIALQLDGGQTLHIIPGLRHQAPACTPDVMRGEETQLVGAMQLHPQLADAACVIMPGTHSKWAQLGAGQVRDFHTQMTGELFALLRQHSVLGRLMPPTRVDTPSAADEAGFLAGVAAAQAQGEQGLPRQLFAVRTLGLMEQLPLDSLEDYLSGLLIGHELRAGLAWRDAGGCTHAPLALIGEPALCQRYRLALEQFKVTAPLLLGNTAPEGLWSLALTAGWAAAPA